MKTRIHKFAGAAGMIFFAALVLFIAGCGEGDKSPSPGNTLYTCGMHPQVIQDHPGNCPICGMKLTPKTAAPATAMSGGQASAEMSTIAIDPVTMQNMGIRTSPVIRGPLRRSLRTVGVIDYDETAQADVTTKFKGWIEKLDVDAMGKQVHRGEPLFEIYSPELYSAQNEYVQAIGTGAGGNETGRKVMIDSARLKLKFFDISDAQIAELEKTREPRKTLSVQSPIDGFVVEKMVVAGMMAEAGMKLYRLADLAIVWVYAQVYEQDLPYLALGQEATMSLSYLPGRKFRGRVTYIYPSVDEKTRTARVRMEFHNPGYFLKPGMYAAVQVTAELDASALLIPDTAVLRGGEKDTVFVALAEGKFEPRTVVLGPRAEDDQCQVLSGLEDGERVVTSGQFMLDSESSMREAIQKMTEPGMNATNHAPHAHATTSDAATPAAAAVYICPMPEHVAIEYSRPGKCPLCGMTLVPVSPELLRRIQPGGVVDYYTCPMPEHGDVRADKPGKCPKCGMTLIPVMKAKASPTPGAIAPQH